MSTQPDHELEDLEDDQSVPPRPEETIADAPGHEGAAEGDTSTPPEGDAS